MTDIAKVTLMRAIRETHEVEYDHEDYLIWLDGDTPDEDNLGNYFSSERDWEQRFTDDTMVSAEPWDADIDEAETKVRDA